MENDDVQESSETGGGLVGTVLAGRYRVARVASTGANTVILDAIDIERDSPVTLKVVRPEHAGDDEFRRKFRRLAEVSNALTHPNIASVQDWGEIELGGESTVFWTVDALGGGSLRDLLDRGRMLEPGQALVVGLEACRALDAAHQKGLFHTELTPSKMVFGADRRLRVVDFGMARLLAEPAWAASASVPTHVARYASPEQALGLPIDAKTDVYALALVMLEAVTGDVPFAADSTVATLSGRVDKLMPVSADLGPLAAVLERAGRPESADRYTAAEFGRALVQAAPKLAKPEPIPVLSSGMFDTTAMRRPTDPTGGLERPAPAPALADVDESGVRAAAAAAAAVAAAAVDELNDVEPVVDEPAEDPIDVESVSENESVAAAVDPLLAAAAVEPEPEPELDVELEAAASDEVDTEPVDADADGADLLATEAAVEADVDPDPEAVDVDVDADPEAVVVDVDAEAVEADPFETAVIETPKIADRDRRSDTVVQPVAATPAAESESRLYDEEPTRRRRGPLVLLAIVLLAGLGALGYAGYVLLQTKSFEVPVLAGASENQAMNQIVGNDWEVTTVGERSDSFPEPDTVIRTEPGPGAVLEEGAPFVLVLSEGPEFRSLPDLDGLPFEVAVRNLADLRLEAVETSERVFSEDVPDGGVVSWRVRGDADGDMQAGADILPGETIEITVSAGPEPRTVPDLAGTTLDDARALAEQLRLGVVEGEPVFSEDIVEGSIVNQVPAPGDSLERDGVVTVQLSLGPDIVAFPDLEGLTFADAQALLLETGFVVGELLGSTDGTFVEATVDGVDVEAGAEYRRGQPIDLIFL